MKIRHINRRASQKMRGRRSWCPSCDRSLVSNGKKCVVCGKRKLPRRLSIKRSEVDIIEL